MKRRESWRLKLTLVMLAAGSLLAASVSGPLPYFEGSSGLAFALRRLPVSGSLLHTAAHPDDEDNPLLVMMSRGRGIRTGLLTLTRGEGGQNEIGPELFEALGIIRTEELMSMHRYDGVQQLFTDAYEFGYSFSVEETFQKWGREEILEQVVEVIRTFRPQVMVSLPRGGKGGGQHHQASALLTEEAFRAAADPSRFPEQLERGLRPWQVKKLYERQRWSDREEDQEEIENALPMHTGVFDPLFGRTWAQIGFESRSLHRCQGMGQIVPWPQPYTTLWKLVDSALELPESESDLFDGIDTSLMAIAEPAAGHEARAPFLIPALERLQSWVDSAVASFDRTRPEISAPALAGGLQEVRRLRERVAESDLPPDVAFEVDRLLEHKESDFAEALRLARGVQVEAFSQAGTVVPGQIFELTVIVFNGGTQDLQLAAVELKTPQGWKTELVVEKDQPPAGEIVPAGESQVRRYRVAVATDAKATRPYWTRADPAVDRYRIDRRYAFRPWAPADVRAAVRYRSHGVTDQIVTPAEYRYTGPWVGGEQRHDLMVVPAISLSLEPKISVLPLDRAEQGRRMRVTAVYHGAQPLTGSVRLEVPEGWSVEPERQEYEFERPGDSRAKTFHVRPGAKIGAGEIEVNAIGDFGGQSYREGYQVIDYDHIRRRHLYHPARSALETLDVRVAPDLRVGYVDGVGDRVPEALDLLGVDYRFLSEDDLAFGDLSRFDTIITGVRAYLERDDLKAYNSRLLQWVQQGGVLIVQYNKYEFNYQFREDSPYAPYPAKVSNGRVTDENAPVTILDARHPVFLRPNRIGEEDWEHWVQERGLYYLGEKSESYRDLLSMSDPFEYNSGEKLGSLVEADYGRGKWIYVGLGLWRQLPAGVPGAYRLLANLISLPKTRAAE